MALGDERKTRREKFVAEQAKIQEKVMTMNQRLQELGSAIGGIDSLLVIEGEQIRKFVGGGGTPVLKDVLFDLMSDLKSHSSKELLTKSIEAGVDFEDKEPYKAVNMTLLGISRGRHVERVGDGFWRRVR